jgi:hypothetical protein
MLTNEIELNHIPTTNQVTNIFTKPLRKQNFLLFQETLDLRSF